jgi:tight adherence protein B
MVVVLGLFLVALLMMLGAVLSVLRARRLDHELKVNKRLQSFSFIPEEGHALRSATDFQGRLAIWLARVGLQIQPGTALTLLGCGLALAWLLWHVVNPLAGLLSAVLIVIGAVLVPQVRYRQRINKLVSQIPLFIDQVIRGLVTGRNVEGAIKLAMDDLRTPLREVIEKANQNVELGADLGDALREAAAFHDVKELHMLALAVQTSRTYGGSPREMLESVVNLIRQREQMQRELRAMTGETRVTAWVLGSLPTAMGAFMVYSNPNYIGPMWDDPTGRVVLMVALAFQTLGALLLWRMVKSI